MSRHAPFPALFPAILLGLSGFASLVDETAWTRVMESLLGHTIPTTATVIAGFMAGLALGSLVAARRSPSIRRPMAVFAVLEAGIALWALALPSMTATVDLAGRTLLGPAWAAPGPADPIRWAAGFALVALPAVAMGIGFPIMVEASARSNRGVRLPRLMGVLYAANTVGAAAGTCAAGFVLIRRFGLHGTLVVGALAGLGASVLAGFASLTTETGRSRRPSGTSVPSNTSAPAPLLMVILMASGFASLALEVLWLRLFVFPLGSNILSFSTVVAALVAAIAVGSWLGSVSGSRLAGPTGLAVVEMGIALTALGTLLGFTHLSDLLTALNGVFSEGSVLETLPGRAALVALLVGLPGLFMGAVLPMAAGWPARDHAAANAGTISGWIYASLTVGNIVGALTAAYLLIPALGITGGILLAAGVAAAAAIAAAWHGRRAKGAILAVGTAMAAGLFTWWTLGGSATAGVAAVRDPHARLLAIFEGIQGTVTVSEVPPLPVMMDNRPPTLIGPVGFGYRMIAVDAVQVAGTAPDLRTTQKLQAHIPLLLHTDPKRVLQIGYGSGETTREAALHGLELLEVVELNRDVVRMAQHWFPGLAGRNFSAIFTDAKLAVRTASSRWDVILNDATYPGMAGSSQLYSLDHFLACRDHLAPGGLVSTWLPVDLPPETFRTVLRTFSTVFPRCSFWLSPNCMNKHGVLVGTIDGGDSEPMTPRPQASWPAPVERSLGTLGFDGWSSVAAIRILDSPAILELAAAAPRNTDDHPILEFPSRDLRVSGNDFWRETLELILEKARPAAHPEAVKLLLAGQAAFLSGHPDDALLMYRRARLAWPESSWPANLIQGIHVQRAQREFSRAMEALQAQQAERAAAHLKRCIQLVPEAAACRGELGRLMLWSGRPEAALEHLSAARRLAADPALFALETGDALRLTGRSLEAELAYRDYLASRPPSFGVLAALAEAVAAQGRIEEAEALALRALRLEPGRQEGIDLLASIRAAAASGATEKLR